MCSRILFLLFRAALEDLSLLSFVVVLQGFPTRSLGLLSRERRDAGHWSRWSGSEESGWLAKDA